MGDWMVLINVVFNDFSLNILLLFSIMVMDNGEVFFIVGEEVLVIIGFIVGFNNDNLF